MKKRLRSIVVVLLYVVCHDQYASQSCDSSECGETTSQDTEDANRRARAQAQIWDKYFPTITSLAQKINTLPYNYEVGHYNYSSLFGDIPLPDRAAEFSGLLGVWAELVVNYSLGITKHWENNDRPEDDFFKISNKTSQFIPYAQKLIGQTNDQFYFRGDLHGDIHSLLKQIIKMRDQRILDDTFRIIPDNVWMIFLGDYVDRGHYGCEVMYVLLRLAIANPDRVILVRGNHEDALMHMTYNFRAEVVRKFANDAVYNFILRIYELLPVVLYIGCPNENGSVVHYLQSCHGGLEIGYDPRAFLDNRQTKFHQLGVLKSEQCIERIVNDPGITFTERMVKEDRWNFELQRWFNMVEQACMRTSYSFGPQNLGFLWNDFNVLNTTQIKKSGRGGYSMEYGQQATKDILAAQSTHFSKIVGVFRGHQHGDPVMMQKLLACRGVHKLWQNASEQQAVSPKCRQIVECSLSDHQCVHGNVVTFNLGPDSLQGQEHSFGYDTYAILRIKDEISSWSLKVFNTQVLPRTMRQHNA